MDEGRPEVPSVEVRRVQERFSRWRAHKRGRLIPKRLWGAAAHLCGAHSVHRVARWLRLNYAAVRDRAHRVGGADAPRPAAFVEWAPGAMPTIAPASAVAEYLLEVAGANERTVRVRVRGAAVAEVAALARALRRKGRQG